jgi:hypothetical protein
MFPSEIWTKTNSMLKSLLNKSNIIVDL